MDMFRQNICRTPGFPLPLDAVLELDVGGDWLVVGCATVAGAVAVAVEAGGVAGGSSAASAADDTVTNARATGRPVRVRFIGISLTQRVRGKRLRAREMVSNRGGSLAVP